MAIKFFNIRSQDTRVAETEPHITAMWASSDRGPNMMQGQDMGWRLAPEVVVEMDEIKENPQLLGQIAQRFNRSMEDIAEPEILLYISNKTAADNAPVGKMADYSEGYNAEIRRMKEERAKASLSQLPTSAEPPKESLADLEKRVELEERLAKARSTPAVETTTTTEVPTATTTTTEPPLAKPRTTTTTTTKP